MKQKEMGIGETAISEAKSMLLKDNSPLLYVFVKNGKYICPGIFQKPVEGDINRSLFKHFCFQGYEDHEEFRYIECHNLEVIRAIHDEPRLHAQKTALNRFLLWLESQPEKMPK